MTNDLITGDNLSRGFLRSILDAAVVDTAVNEYGNLVVNGCLVFLDKEAGSIILARQWPFNKRASESERFKCANVINRDCGLVRAAVSEEDTLLLTYQWMLAGGITKDHFVAGVQLVSFAFTHAAANICPDLLDFE